LIADTHSILARWRNYFSKLFNILWVNATKQNELHTAKPVVPEPSTFQFNLDIEKLKRHKSTGVEQISAELRQGVEQIAVLYIKLLFHFGIRRNCLMSGRSRFCTYL
jgi:hypothetical protein